MGGWGAAADLRPQLNAAYDMTETITPNIDKLAKSATVFHRPHVHSGAAAPTPILLAPPWGRCDHRSRPARCSAQTVARGLWLGYVAKLPIGGAPAHDQRPA